MKKLLWMMVLVPAIAMAQSNEGTELLAEKTEATAARIRFIKSEHNFGQIKEGEKVTYIFRYKNIGDASLKVTNVKTTCGCTVSEWTKESVAPGDYGTVKATFDSHGKKGMQKKVISIFSNAIDPETSVKIIAEVLSDD